ncbi:APC family permease [Rhodococcus sp. JVH1]|uniref:APC family permease n=1 Tax=Rhodococcus sp. JVH1 TaxID=745408 RepID=UPI003524A8B2
MFTVLAFNAPLAVMAGFVPIVVGFGNGQGAASTFIVVGALLLLFAVGLTTMSKFMKSPGAFYCYIAAGLGKVPGLGGAFVAVSAYLTIGAASYAYGGILVNDLVTSLLHGPELPWWVWSLVLWVAASTLSLLEIDLSAKVLGAAMCAEVAIVVLWQVAVAIKGGPEGYSVGTFTPSAFTSGSLSFALLFAVLCVTGFEAVAVFREETRDPVKTVPRATYAAVAIVAGLYAIGAWAYVVAVGPTDAPTEAAADPSGSFLASLSAYVGTAAVDIATVLLVTSAFAALLATQNIASRYLYALGSDGVLSPKLGKVHPKHGSPFVAAIVVAAAFLVLDGVPAIMGTDPVITYASLAGFGGFCLLLMMTITSVAVIVFFRRTPDHSAGVWRSVIAPSVSLVGLAIILFLAAKNMGAVIGGSDTAGYLALTAVAVVALSGVALALRYKKFRPEVYSRIGRQDV